MPAGSGKDPGELLAMLERIRAEEPDEPLWKGVKAMTAEAHGVRVTFEPGIDPPLYETDGSRAACLLYKRLGAGRARAAGAQDLTGSWWTA